MVDQRTHDGPGSEHPPAPARPIDPAGVAAAPTSSLPASSPFPAPEPARAWAPPSAAPERPTGPAPNHAAQPAAGPSAPTGSIPAGWAPPASARGPAPVSSGWAPPASTATPPTPAPAARPLGPVPAVTPPTAWWGGPGAGPAPTAPPEYDPARVGGLGAAGGLPVLPGVEPAPSDGGGRRSGIGSAVLVGLLSAVIASVITAGLFLAFTDRDDPEVVADRGPAPTLVPALDIYELLEKAQPSVVSIRTDITSPTAGTTPFGAGSGVVISEDGLVLTNAHVIAGSSHMTVALFDGAEREATLVGSFPDDDIALIRITDPEDLTPAELGSSAEIEVGDPVVAIGNALNLGGPPSVTEGIVSAKDRNIQTREGTLRNLIQTDAAINPGNSGGPLLNAQGQVVGINTAIIDNAQNIGFAISIDLLKPLIEDLKAGRGDITPESPFLGVSTQTLRDVTDAVLERYGVTADEGAFVSDVVPGSGAAEAGLQPGDVIVAIDGEAVTSSTDVGAIIRNREAGETITIEIERQGEPEEITARLKSRAETGN